MEFAIPGNETGQPNVSLSPGPADDNNNDTMTNTQDFNGGTVSLSSSGNSGNLSQATHGSVSLPGGTGMNVAVGQHPGAPVPQQVTGQRTQKPAAGIPGIFNPLQIPGIAGAMAAGAMAPSFALGNNNAAAATIGVPLTVPGSNNNTLNSAGQKRKSETDLSCASKEQRTLDTCDASSLNGSGPPIKDEAELEKMNPAERRRYERNLREQQRSYRISQQIKQLRDVLEECKIPFKPNKFSILVSVVEYIKQLQTRAIMLDAEHQKLIDTIRQTNEMVSTGQVPSSMESSSDSMDAVTSGGTDASELTLAAAKELDFQVVFQCCPSGMAVCSLDGRILACNKSFETALGVKKDEILQQSMFIYIRNHQDIFEAMADLLKRSSVASEAGEGVVRASHLLFWCGHVMSLQNRKSALTITLSSTADGNPKYFTLTVAEL